MSYFNYHATAKRLIADGKLIGYCFCESYHGISPALVLLFDDLRRPAMPIREARFEEYRPLLKNAKALSLPNFESILKKS